MKRLDLAPDPALRAILSLPLVGVVRGDPIEQHTLSLSRVLFFLALLASLGRIEVCPSDSARGCGGVYGGLWK